MRPDPHTVAARLGLDPATIARLEARGFLTRFAFTEQEIRERLYRAHVANMLRRGGVWDDPPSRRRPSLVNFAEARPLRRPTERSLLNY